MGWRIYLIPGDVQAVEDSTIPFGWYEVVTEAQCGGGGISGPGIVEDLGRTAIVDGQEVRGLEYYDIPADARYYYRCVYRCSGTVRAWSQSSHGLCSWDITPDISGGMPRVTPFQGPVYNRSVWRWPFHPDGRPDPLGNMPPPGYSGSALPVRCAAVSASAYPFEPDRPQE